MRRGFKAEAKKIAHQVRWEIGLGPVSPLDPWRLAEWLGIPIEPLSGFKETAAGSVRYFSTVGRSDFSAVTIFDGPRRLIVHNDYHSRARQVSNVCHEIAHGLLWHPPAPILDERGCRYWNKEIEDEANWLSGVLLVPDEAAIAVVKDGCALELAALKYGVSKQLIRFRINVSGARKRVQRFTK